MRRVMGIKVSAALAASSVLALLGISACKKHSSADAAPVNAAVPEKLKYRVVFEPRDVVAGAHRHVTYSVPVPKGWRSDDVGGVVAADKAIDGDSSIFLKSSCDASSCTPEDWNAAIDREIKASNVEVVRDEHGDHRRVVVAKPALVPDDVSSITVYWWRDNATEYHSCQVRLAGVLKDAAPAFEKACSVATADD
jgi:hypothetical protein